MTDLNTERSPEHIAISIEKKIKLDKSLKKTTTTTTTKSPTMRQVPPKLERIEGNQ